MNNLLLSFELVALIKWLLENKKQELDELVVQAVKSNFLQYEQDNLSSIGAHAIINEFIHCLERNLKLQQQEHDQLETGLSEQLHELANDLDLSNFDEDTILKGFKQAKSQVAKLISREGSDSLNKGQMKAVLMQKLLDNWQPNKAAAQA